MKAVFKTAWGYQGDNMNLPVADLESAIPFYEQKMGFRLESRNEVPHNSAVLERDGIRIGLCENGGDPEQDGCAFEVGNVEAAAAEFRANGLDAMSELKFEENNGSKWKVFYIIAPDGLCYWIGERQAE